MKTLLHTTRGDRLISKAVRAVLGLSNTRYPIEFSDGFDEPQLRGHRQYWTTPSGKTVVRFPNAYKWPTKYHHSTLHIVVGAGWVLAVVMEAEKQLFEERVQATRTRAEARLLLQPGNRRPPTGVRFTAEGGIKQNDN